MNASIDVIPKAHLTADGRFRPPPEFADAALRCPICRRLLVRADSGWTCIEWHIGLVSDEEIRTRLLGAAKWWNGRKKTKRASRIPFTKLGPIFRRLREWGRWRSIFFAIPVEGEQTPGPDAPTPRQRPWCRRCREQDRVVLPTDSEPARKRFSSPYCERCRMPLDMAAHPDQRHRLPPNDFD